MTNTAVAKRGYLDRCEILKGNFPVRTRDRTAHYTGNDYDVDVFLESDAVRTN